MKVREWVKTLTKARPTVPQQFDFKRNWKKMIVPLLDDPGVVLALNYGMWSGDHSYRPGDPPWKYGNGPLNGNPPKPGTLSWYQPWGLCHWIAPFCWALGKKLFSKLNWGFITSDRHTVVIGWDYDWHNPEWVMDILVRKKPAAEDSLALAKAEGWKFHRSFERYAASFFLDPETAFAMICESPLGKDLRLLGLAAQASLDTSQSQTSFGSGI